MLVKVPRKSVQISHENYLSFTEARVKELQVGEGELMQVQNGRSEAFIIMQWKGAR